MRAALRFVAAIVIGLGAGCGGGDASRQDACENVCGCLMFSSMSEGQECVLDCVNSTTSADITLTDQACINCAAEATCSGIISGTACAVECDDGSGS